MTDTQTSGDNVPRKGFIVVSSRILWDEQFLWIDWECCGYTKGDSQSMHGQFPFEAL